MFKMNFKASVFSILFMLMFLAASLFTVSTPHEVTQAASYDKVLYFPLSKYPQTGDHIRDAIAAGHSSICTIDRGGTDERRAASLAPYPTKPGYDRDEWPMAMCEEGGAGADVRYISPSDNRGAGAWVGNQVSGYPDDTRVKFIVR